MISENKKALYNCCNSIVNNFKGDDRCIDKILIAALSVGVVLHNFGAAITFNGGALAEV